MSGKPGRAGGLPSMIPRRGLPLRIFLLQTAALLILGLVLGLLNGMRTRQVLEEGTLGRAQSLVRNLAYNAKLGVLTADRAGLQELLDGVRDEGLFAFLVVRGEDGGVLASLGRTTEMGFVGLSSENLSIDADRNPSGTFVLAAPVVAGSTLGATEEELLGMEETTAGSREERFVGQVAAGISPDLIEGPARRALLVNLAASAVGVLVLSLLLVPILAIGFSPLSRMAFVFEDIATGEGDLTRRIQVTGRDEIGTSALWFNRFIEYLHDVIRRVTAAFRSQDVSFASLEREEEALLTGAREQNAAVENGRKAVDRMGRSAQAVSSSVETLRHNMDTNSAAIEQLAANIQQIDRSGQALLERLGQVDAALEAVDGSLRRNAEGVDSIRQNAGSAAQALARMEASTQEIDSNAGFSARISREALDLVEKGRGKMAGSLEGMAAIAAAFEEIRSQMVGFREQMKSIVGMLGTIQEVADSTNLLSLNAAIIAAQAKEHGRGFSVVAVEIKKLAEQAGISSREIESTIGDIHQRSDAVMGALATGLERVTQGSSLSGEAQDSLDRIAEAVRRTEEHVSSIALSTKEQAEGIGLINREVHDLVSSLNTVNQSIQEQSGQSGRIAQGVSELTEETARVRSAIGVQTSSSHLLAQGIGTVAAELVTIHRSVEDQKEACSGMTAGMEEIAAVSRRTLESAHRIEELIRFNREQQAALRQALERLKT